MVQCQWFMRSCSWAVVTRMWLSLKSFGMRPLPGVRVTLVSGVPSAPFTLGMLPGCIAGHYRAEEAHLELRPLCRFAGAQFFQEQAIGVDLEKKQVLFAERPPARFDVLSINTGSTPDLRAVPGAALHALPINLSRRFWNGWRHCSRALIPTSPPSVAWPWWEAGLAGSSCSSRSAGVSSEMSGNTEPPGGRMGIS